MQISSLTQSMNNFKKKLTGSIITCRTSCSSLLIACHICLDQTLPWELVQIVSQIAGHSLVLGFFFTSNLKMKINIKTLNNNNNTHFLIALFTLEGLLKALPTSLPLVTGPFKPSQLPVDSLYSKFWWNQMFLIATLVFQKNLARMPLTP